MKNDIVAAISTPIGHGAINIIRLTGDGCLSIAEKIFSAKKLNYNNIVQRHMYLGTLTTENGNEKCLMVFFKGPNSYTGEDMIEFQCHGGELLTKSVLKACFDAGAKQSQPGEFSKRAFLNGKLSLDEAEGVIDIITAQSEAEIKAGYQLTEGKLKFELTEIQKILTEILAEIEVALDYPEHDIEEITNKHIIEKITLVQTKLKQLLKNSNESSLIKSGINVVLVGKPNVGKSSILNALLGEDRAIVTEIAGTTRDTLKETILLNGVKFNFIDTAGLRESSDTIEKIGITKTKKEIEKAGIILFILDSSSNTSEEEISFYETIKSKNHLVVLNKSDIKKENAIPIKTDLSVSAKNSENIEKIKDLIYKKTMENKLDFEEIVLTNLRHINILNEAFEDVSEMVSSAKVSLDISAFKIKKIWNLIGKITGETENEIIIDEIFSRFCLGK